MDIRGSICNLCGALSPSELPDFQHTCNLDIFTHENRKYLFCVCVCVCARVHGKERERDRQAGRQADQVGIIF
jgi:hypothetical protein